MTDFDDAFAAAWNEAKTPLERMYDRWVGNAWEPDPPRTTYRIWDAAGLPIACHLEGCLDRWVLDGLESQRRATVFVCDHGVQVCGPGISIPKISSVSVEKVSRFEEADRPTE